MKMSPQEKLKNIIIDCCYNRISITGVSIFNDDYLFQINGFSKSGIAEVFIENNEIICKTRYDKRAEIEDFRDLAIIALDWYINYKDRPPFESPDPNWVKVWENFDLVKITTETKQIINYK